MPRDGAMIDAGSDRNPTFGNFAIMEHGTAAAGQCQQIPGNFSHFPLRASLCKTPGAAPNLLYNP